MPVQAQTVQRIHQPMVCLRRRLKLSMDTAQVLTSCWILPRTVISGVYPSVSTATAYSILRAGFGEVSLKAGKVVTAASESSNGWPAGEDPPAGDPAEDLLDWLQVG